MRGRDPWAIACMGVVLLLFCGACSRQWTVAPGREHGETSGGRWPCERGQAAVSENMPTASVSMAPGEAQSPPDEPVVACDCRRRCRHSLCCRLDSVLCEAKHDVADDYRNFYSCSTARGLLWGVGGASVLANTSLDQDFRDWVQDDARSEQSDDFGDFWKPFGRGEIFIPSFAGLALAGKLLEDVPVCGRPPANSA